MCCKKFVFLTSETVEKLNQFFSVTIETEKRKKKEKRKPSLTLIFIPVNKWF